MRVLSFAMDSYNGGSALPNGGMILILCIMTSVSAFIPIVNPHSLSRGMSKVIDDTESVSIHSTHLSTFGRKIEPCVTKRMNTCNNSLRQQSNLYLSENYDHDGSSSGIDTGIDDESRRLLLRSIIASSSTITGIITGNPLNAQAEGEDLLEIDQQKVVMQVDTKNTPQKYGVTQQSSSTSTMAQYDEEDWMTQVERRRIDIFEKAAPSVVFIDTYVESRDAFSTNVMEVPIGTGSGFVWDEKGHIVTNYHVVRNAKSAQIAILSRKFDDDDESNINKDFDEEGNEIVKKTPSSKQQRVAASPTTPLSQAPIRSTSMRNDAGVTNYSRKVYKAKVVGVDPGKDIAVLKIDAPIFDLFPIDVGTSTGLKVGQSAYAIGNPFGLDHTLTVGVISGIGREVKSPIGRPITNVIQTDAAINPGNSGGPLLNSSGKLIGMNTSIYSPSGASAGIGFAIPIDSVRFIVDTLIRDGKVVRPILGISFLESKQARALGIEKGVLVLDVPTNSNAYKAGLRGTTRKESGLIDIGDIIIKVENFKINTEADLFGALESFKPGDFVRVTVNRVELESDLTSPSAKLIQKTISIQLRASVEVNISKYLYSSQ